MRRTPTNLALTAALAAALAAQVPAPSQPGADGGDSPDHGVARLSLIDGNVSVRHGDAGDVSAAALNAPLTATDRVETGDSGRAEIQFDAFNMIRLAPQTEVRLSELQYKQYQVQIAEGTIAFKVLRDNDAQIEISTPTVSVKPDQAGTYRVTVQQDGMTEITVRQGAAQIFGPQGSEDLAVGQTMEARGTPNDPEFRLVAAIPLDDWDRWNLDRDRAFQQVSSGRVPVNSPDIAGTESLDPYGQWQNDPTYGNVWVPNEPPDWAPYQLGRWSYLDYYGWTWVSADPWGWAPYHYGRWFHAGFGWAWWPGPVGYPYYWRPALVGFFGWGPGVGIGFGFGFGNVGWVPLAPYETFRPWYGRGLMSVNVAANGNIVNTYRNARFANGITSVNAAQFGRGAIARGNIVRPGSADLARAGVVNGALPLQSSAASRRFSDAAASTRGMPQTGSNRQFYSTRPQAAARTTGANPGNWRRFDPAVSGGNRGVAGPQGRGATGNAVQPRGSYPQVQGNAGRGPTAPVARPQQPAAQPQQPVRINPSIVQNRSSSGGGASRPPSRGGSFGGSHSSGGGGHSGGGGGHGGGGHR